MGFWGVGFFQSDAAADWLAAMEGCEGVSCIEEAIENAIVAGTEGVDADTGCVALAAAEVLCRMLGCGVPAPDDIAGIVDGWAGPAMAPRADAARLAPRAVLAVDRVRGGESELARLWAESVHRAAWRAAVDGLAERLRGVRGV